MKNFMKNQGQNFFLLGVLSYLVISLLGIAFLVRILLPPGFIIAGHDSGLALDSKSFLETRFFAWDERINFGEDNSLLFGSLTLHSFDYIFSLLSGTPYAGNQLNLFFWFAIIFIAALIFAYQLKERLGREFIIIFPFLVVINFYIFQSVFILERAKYSLVAGSLIFLAIIIRFFDRKISLINSAIFSSLVFTLFNGGSWLGLPLFGGLLIIITVILVFLLVEDFKRRSFKESLRFLLFLGISGGLFILINSYSLLPYIQTFFVKDYQIIQSSMTLNANKAWLDYISQGSSFLNIFRMQGVPDWYSSSFTAAQMHPFASFYLENPLMIFLSYLIPITAFVSLILVKNQMQKRIVGVFAVISLVSMVFMAGTRSPLGFIYEFLFQNVPGFVIFRSSFYKFGYAFIIAYSAILTFSFVQLINLLASKFKSRFKIFLKVVLTLMIIFSWFGYHFKLFDPSIFNWRTGFSTRIKVPDYVNDYKNYVKSDNADSGRVLILPPSPEAWLSDGYDFGYWSLSTIHYSLTKQNVLVNSQSSPIVNGSWTKFLIDSLKNKKSQEILELASKLGVNRFLLKEDALFGEEWSGGEDPKIYQEILDSLSFMEKERVFGKWTLYRIKSKTKPLIFAENNFTELTTDSTYKVSTLKPLIYKDITYFNDRKIKDKVELLNDFTYQKIDILECKSCIIEDSITMYQLVWPRILPNSLVFPLKIINENYQFSKITDPQEKITYYYGLIIKRAAEIESMIYIRVPDRYIVENLKSIRDYLDKILEITKTVSNPNEDFNSLKKVLDNIQTVENNFTRQILPDNRGTLTELVKDEITTTLWKIHELKRYYDPIYSDIDQWGNKKIFDINIPTDKDYTVYLNELSLPIDATGEVILPEMILNGRERITLSPSDRNQNWLTIPKDKFNSGKNELVLNFKKTDNILVIKESLILDTPEGKKSCHQGKINSPLTRKAYLLKVKTSGQTLRVFSRVDNQDELKQFLDWKNEIRIEDYYNSDYFRYLYIPIAPVDKLSIYICGEYQNLPQFQEFNIEEVFEPEIIGVEKFNISSRKLPEITYTRLDPTRFQVNIKSAKDPFILIMNQKYSPLWKLIDQKSKTEIKTKTFPIDSYANGWLIDQKGDLEFLIEYMPQRYFEKGIIISGVAILLLAGVLGLNLAKRIRK